MIPPFWEAHACSRVGNLRRCSDDESLTATPMQVEYNDLTCAQRDVPSGSAMGRASLPLARAVALRSVTARVKDSGAACLFAVLATAGWGIQRPPVVLEPEEYRLWEGDWYEASSGSVKDNVYVRLEVSGADRHGFGYQLEERTVPSGPNAEWSGERTARFDNPLRATDPATGHVFSLSTDPADSCSRIIEVREGGPGTSGWSPHLGPDPTGGTFGLDRPTGGAGSRSRRP